MHDALASALDKVLILSGGDPDIAAEALNERFALHMGQSNTSTTVSTVSSPMTLSRGSSLPEQILVAPAQLRSPSVGVFSPSRQPRKPAQRSSLRATPASRTTLVPPPLFTSRSLPLPVPRAKPLPSTWLEIQSDSDDEPVVHTRPFAEGHESPLHVHNSVDRTAKPGAEARAPSILPLVLAQIMPEDSRLSSNDLSYIKEAILANPFYLGEPRHIGLHNSKGSTEHRIMRTPTPGAPTPEKWYAIACGSQVGIFLSWMDAGFFVQGKKGNLHKSFDVELDAYIWLQVALLKGTITLLN